MIKIIVDSTCDLSDDFIAKHQIDVIPLQVLINEKSYKDKFELDIHTLYKHIEHGDDIKTSLPNYDDIYPVFEKYAKNNQPFIFFSFSKVMSGTHNFANLLIKDLNETYKTKMYALDTKNGGLASAMILEQVIKYQATNPTFEALIEHGEMLADKMHHIIMLEDLTQLRKGGRISAMKSMISHALSIKPVLQIFDGGIKSHKHAIGTKRALNELLNYVIKHAKNKDTEIGLLYSANEELMQKMADKLKSNGYMHIKTGRIASVMTAHIGLDAVSICFL